MRIRVLKEAALELDEAAAYLADRSIEAARGMLYDYEKAVNLVCSYPHGFAADHRGIRRHTLSRYPYSLVYKVVGKTLTLIAFMHQKRRPGYWASRIKK